MNQSVSATTTGVGTSTSSASFQLMTKNMTQMPTSSSTLGMR